MYSGHLVSNCEKSRRSQKSQRECKLDISHWFSYSTWTILLWDSYWGNSHATQVQYLIYVNTDGYNDCHTLCFGIPRFHTCANEGELVRNCIYEGEACGILTKSARGYPIEKRWKIMKRRICAHEVRGTCCWGLENVICSPFMIWVSFQEAPTWGMLRLVKLTRLSRISRLLRSVPELAIIVPLGWKRKDGVEKIWRMTRDLG